MKVIRVFPSRTKATPVDDLAYYGSPTLFAQADEAHISVTFTWDIPKAEQLAEEWRQVAPVKIGGPAYNNPGGEFILGMYLKLGYVITSRGCPNKCWFCSVWKREDGIKELPITDGWIVQDDNLLACSRKHIEAVFKMLKRQPQKAEFLGGLEARLLMDWHCELLADLKPKRMYFAYDTQDDYEPLVNADKLLRKYDITNTSNYCCYVLIGYPKDTFTDAERRLMQIVKLGIMPFAMLYRDRNGRTVHEWRTFQRLWARPAIMRHKFA